MERYYDFDAPVILFDDFDPRRRVFRTVRDFGDAFWPGFSQLRSAAHAIETPPEVIVEGDLASARMVFIAVLTQPDGSVVATRATNSQVWRRTERLGWRIVRDQTGVAVIPVDEARRAFGTVRRPVWPVTPTARPRLRGRAVRRGRAYGRRTILPTWRLRASSRCA